MKNLILAFTLLASFSSHAADNMILLESDSAMGHYTYELIDSTIQKVIENGVDANLKYVEVKQSVNNEKYPYTYYSAVLFFCNKKYQYSPYTDMNLFPGKVYGVFVLPENSSLLTAWDYVCSKENSPVLDFANVTPRLKQIFVTNNETTKILKKKLGQ